MVTIEDEMCKCSVQCCPTIAFCYWEEEVGTEMGPLECDTNRNFRAECGLFCPGTGMIGWKLWDFSARHQERLSDTGGWCHTASACSAQAAPSTTSLWLLRARGSSQDYCWGLAAVVGKESMGQREIRSAYKTKWMGVCAVTTCA